jgi:hypothetical protein
MSLGWRYLLAQFYTSLPVYRVFFCELVLDRYLMRRLFFTARTMKMISFLDLFACETLLVNCPSTKGTGCFLGRNLVQFVVSDVESSCYFCSDTS